MQRIERDRSRFRQIVRGHVKKDLRKYMSQRELIGRQGKRLVSIPLPQIELPRFRYGAKQAGGVGQGDGDPGDRIGRGDPQPGSGQAGDQPGLPAVEHGGDGGSSAGVHHYGHAAGCLVDDHLGQPPPAESAGRLF